jgi:hypothetical protein
MVLCSVQKTMRAVRNRAYGGSVRRSLRPEILAVLALCVAVGGCGSSSNTFASSAALIAGPPISKARARAGARAINLQPADVPGMTDRVTIVTLGGRSIPAVVQKPEGETTGVSLGIAIPGCVSVGNRAGVVAGMSGTLFHRPRPEQHVDGTTLYVLPIGTVQSTVYVMQSAALARQDVATIGSAGVRACVEHQLTQQRKTNVENEPDKSQVQVSSLPSPLPGVKVYGMRVSGTLAAAFTGGGARPPFYNDTFSFAVGATEVVLKVTSAPHAPTATERRLLGLLYNRAEAHKL